MLFYRSFVNFFKHPFSTFFCHTFNNRLVNPLLCRWSSIREYEDELILFLDVSFLSSGSSLVVMFLTICIIQPNNNSFYSSTVLISSPRQGFSIYCVGRFYCSLVFWNQITYTRDPPQCSVLSEYGEFPLFKFLSYQFLPLQHIFS